MKKVLSLFLSFVMLLSITAGLQFSADAANPSINVNVNNAVYDYDYANEVLKLVNAERAKEGVQPLKMDSSLLDTAMLRSVECSMNLDHTRPDGTICFTANSKMNGENIAAGYRTPADVVEGWMGSESHRRNILDPQFKCIGVGCVEIGTLYWSQCFSRSDGDGKTKTGTAVKSLTIKVDTGFIKLRYYGIDNVDGTNYPDGYQTMILTENANWDVVSTPLSPDLFDFSSSDESVFTVDEKGKIYANSQGRAVFKATLKADKTKTVSKEISIISAHKYEVVTTPATLTSDGSVSRICTDCGDVQVIEKISSPTYMALGSTSYEYTGKDIGPGVTVKDRDGKTLKYKTDYSLVYDSGRINVGTYGVTIHFMGKYSGSQTLYFDITPIGSEKCTAKLSKTEYDYTGRDIGPGVTVTDSNGKKLVYKTDYTLTYDQGRVEPGRYSVTVNYIGNYSGTETLYFTIKEPSKFNAKLSATSYVYTGKDIGPGVTVTDSNGKKLVYKTDYTLAYAQGRTNVGRYGITVNYIGKYAGTPSETLYFNITPKSFSQCTPKPSAWSYYYTGKAIGPGMSVTDNTGRKLVYRTDYTLTYDQGRINVGRYAIKVNFMGNYTGSKTIYFYIIPKQVSIKSVTPLKQGFTVNWNTQLKEITGYQVQYSQNSSFSGSAVLTFTNPSASTVTRNYMGANKKYYVRIRTYKYVTVDGKTTTLYSGWSDVKTVTTKK